MRRMLVSVGAVCLGIAALGPLVGCGGGGEGGGPVSGSPQGLGDPIENLTASELAAFERGKVLFEKRFAPSEGLGPLYNATSCTSCHSTPVTGGSSQLYRNFYLALSGNPAQVGGQSNLPGLPSPVVPSFGGSRNGAFSLTRGRLNIPHGGVGGQPVQVAQRNALPLFGIGLFEFVSDATILANADPSDADGDGIHGRANFDAGLLGRFGVKAQSATIERFTRPPLFNQMGITSRPLTTGLVQPQQASGGDDEVFEDTDNAPDPEMPRDQLLDLVAFSRFLAPPMPRPFNAAATRGEALFTSVGCVRCHIPSLPSSRGELRAYTDLLLHEMGPELADGIAFGTPQASTISDPTTHAEFRTQPLWGVSKHAPFMHDGRAETLREAILLHGGEAEAIRIAFEALTSTEQADVIAFLEHL